MRLEICSRLMRRYLITPLFHVLFHMSTRRKTLRLDPKAQNGETAFFFIYIWASCCFLRIYFQRSL